MAEYFTFTAGNAFVTGAYGLSGPEIQLVRRWQNDLLGYLFSFHTLHDKGWPVYVTEGSGKQMSKMNLKGVTNVDFIDNKSVTKIQAEDAIAVVTANLAAFQKMAKNYYEGITSAAPSVQKCSCGGAFHKGKCLSCKKAQA